MHVDRLERIQQGPAGGHPRAMVGLQATDNNDASHWRGSMVCEENGRAQAADNARAARSSRIRETQ
jgi:hypothetical protein